jgi:hypothetical protein
MDFKTILKLSVAGLILLAIGIAIGRFSQKDTKSVSDAKVQENKNTHTQTKTITVKEPSGKVETTTITDTVITAKETTDTKTVQQTAPQKSKINISAMAGYDIFHPSLEGPTYGLVVSKEFVGPITLGVFGLTNGTVGVTAGISF